MRHRALALLSIVAVAVTIIRSRHTLTALLRQTNAPTTQQWPLNQAELRALMEQVITNQRTLSASIAAADERTRAEAFQRYYEG